MAYWIFEQGAGQGRGGVLPSATTMLQAGAFGAILGGATTGAVNAMRVKAGEIDRDQAVQETVGVAARGAASMAIASIAAHLVRSFPAVGLVTLLAVGAAALTMGKRAAATPEPAGAAPEKAAKTAVKRTVPVAAKPARRRPARTKRSTAPAAPASADQD